MEGRENYKHDEQLKNLFHMRGVEAPGQGFTDRLMSKVYVPATDRKMSYWELTGVLSLLVFGLVAALLLWPELGSDFQVIFNIANNFNISSLWVEAASLPPLIWGSIAVIALLLLLDRFVIKMLHSI
jgi:hypothetical protein